METSVYKESPLFLKGGGEMGALIREYDWSFTSIGLPDQWPQSLRTALSIILNSRFPMFLFWGIEHLCFYNDAYRPSLGNDGKHPYALGKPGAAVWPEIWDDIKPQIDQVLSGGEAVWFEDRLLPIYRNGKLEDVYWTYSYSAVVDESGKPRGVFVATTETTGKVENFQKLKASEQKFRSLIEEASVASCLFSSRDMIVEIANKTMLAYWGKDESVFGQPLRLALPELEGQPFLQILDEVFTTGKTYTACDARADLVVNGVLGTYYFDYTYKAVRNADGTIYGVMDTAVDVTEKVMNRKHLESAEARARLAIESADLGTYEINLFTNEIWFSERFAAIWGVPQGTSRPNLAFSIHPDDRARRGEAHAEAVQTGRLAYEVRLLWNDGSVHWVRVRGKVLYDAQGTPATLLGVVQDITEQKLFAEELSKQVKQRTQELEAAQASLLQGNQYLQNVINGFESALAVLMPIYKDGQIVDFQFRMTNTAYTPYAGLSPDAIQGKRAGEVFPGYYQTDAFAKYVETFETGQTNSWDLHYNQDELDVYLKVTALRMENEVVVNFIDFTELKHLQLDLEEKVRELERSNANLEEFARAASHDLKEPIRKIHFFTDKLKLQLSGRTSEEEQQLFNRVESASNRMSTLVDDLLLYAATSQKPHEKEAIDLNEKLKRVLEDLEMDIEQRKATITADPLPTVWGYRRQLQQLFQNLIANALKYSKPEVLPVIRITAGTTTGREAGFVANHDANRVFHVIQIQDNGIGFEQKDAERIFNVFTRLHGNTEYRGTGVGLSIVQKVAENHGGHVTAEGALGQGATFKVYLPQEHII